MARASWEGFRKHAPERRPFLLTRSGHAGVQRYAWTWTGDVESTWEGLRTTLRALLGLSLSGVYFVGSDIGGFSGNPSPELYLRWFQMAALTPFFRLHAARWTKRREPWRFGEEVLEGVRRAMALRESLLPYLYTLAHRASREGKPLLRPLFLEGGPTRRRPSSWGRPSWWPPSWRRGRGPRRCPCPRAAGTPGGGPGPPGPHLGAASRPLDRIPLLVRAGTVLPLLEEGGLALHLYPGAEGAEGRLYWDEGEGEGPYRLDRFRLLPAEGASASFGRGKGSSLAVGKGAA